MSRHKQHRHPKARRRCDGCNGYGWFISYRTDDGMYAVERCDACLYEGKTRQDAQYDADVVGFALRSGVVCSRRYPCYVRCDCGGRIEGNVGNDYANVCERCKRQFDVGDRSVAVANVLRKKRKGKR